METGHRTGAAGCNPSSIWSWTCFKCSQSSPNLCLQRMSLCLCCLQEHFRGSMCVASRFYRGLPQVVYISSTSGHKINVVGKCCSTPHTMHSVCSPLPDEVVHLLHFPHNTTNASHSTLHHMLVSHIRNALASPDQCSSVTCGFSPVARVPRAGEEFKSSDNHKLKQGG